MPIIPFWSMTWFRDRCHRPGGVLFDRRPFWRLPIEQLMMMMAALLLWFDVWMVGQRPRMGWRGLLEGGRLCLRSSWLLMLDWCFRFGLEMRVYLEIWIVIDWGRFHVSIVDCRLSPALQLMIISNRVSKIVSNLHAWWWWWWWWGNYVLLCAI